MNPKVTYQLFNRLLPLWHDINSMPECDEKDEFKQRLIKLFKQ